VKFSLFYEVQSDDESVAGAKRAMEEMVEQVVLADQLGYHRVWLPEHHFTLGYSWSSCPEVLLAYLAARTQRIRLGHGIVHLPFTINHPVRVAERIATLDLISGGRVDFGGGRATTDLELSGFGVDPEVTRIQWETALSIIPRMWMDEVFEYKGDLFSFPRRQITPRPFQTPHPPMWVAANQPATIAFAGEHGLGVLAFGLGEAKSNEYVRMYREKLRNAKPFGAAVNPNFAALRLTLCLPTDEEAWNLQGPRAKLICKQLQTLYAPWIKGRPPKTYEHAMQECKQLYDWMETATKEDLVAAGGACIGSPETCLGIIKSLEAAGVDEMLLHMQVHDTPHEKVMQSIQLIADRVMPHFDATTRAAHS
jgi:alkanesulfonate monooxygenase SsuD/methylene tetrahydromethanopterin reductase-like flavin-dependent oxidoreductase (luciferase family)